MASALIAPCPYNDISVSYSPRLNQKLAWCIESIQESHDWLWWDHIENNLQRSAPETWFSISISYLICPKCDSENTTLFWIYSVTWPSLHICHDIHWLIFLYKTLPGLLLLYLCHLLQIPSAVFNIRSTHFIMLKSPNKK